MGEGGSIRGRNGAQECNTYHAPGAGGAGPGNPVPFPGDRKPETVGEVHGSGTDRGGGKRACDRVHTEREQQRGTAHRGGDRRRVPC